MEFYKGPWGDGRGGGSDIGGAGKQFSKGRQGKGRGGVPLVGPKRVPRLPCHSPKPRQFRSGSPEPRYRRRPLLPEAPVGSNAETGLCRGIEVKHKGTMAKITAAATDTSIP